MATIRQIVSRSDMTRVDMSRPLRGRGTQSSTRSAWCLVLEAWRLGGGGCCGIFFWPSMSKLRFGMAVLGLLHPYIVRRRWNSFPCFSSFGDRLSSTQAVVFISRGTLMLHLLAWPEIPGRWSTYYKCANQGSRLKPRRCRAWGISLINLIYSS